MTRRAKVGVHPPTGHVWVERDGAVLAHVFCREDGEEIAAALNAQQPVEEAEREAKVVRSWAELMALRGFSVLVSERQSRKLDRPRVVVVTPLFGEEPMVSVDGLLTGERHARTFLPARLVYNDPEVKP